MRVAGHTYAYRDRPLAEALEELAALDFEFVEVWLGHAKGGPDSVARELAALGLQAAAVSAGGFYRSETPARSEAFELARAIEAPVVVACVAPHVLAEISGSVPPGFVLCVENHWDQPLSTAQVVEQAIGERPDLMACLDTGHSILAGVRPERFAASLGNRLGHIHLKDARAPTVVERFLGRRLRRRLLPRPEPVFPGRGVLQIQTLRRVLERMGYRATVTLEHEGSEPSTALAELLRGWRSSEVDGAGVNRA